MGNLRFPFRAREGAILSNDLIWALASDTQFPYHDKRALNLWFKVLRYLKPDVVDYLGDISDQACFSRFTKGTPDDFLIKYQAELADGKLALPLVQSEEQVARDFYADTRELLPDAELFVALGNHDIRVFDFAAKHLQEELDQFTPENLWGLDNVGADYIYYGDLPKHRYGDLYAHHGLSVSQHAGDSVRKDVESLGVSLIRGHSHRMGDFYKTYELRGETLRGFEIGHLADIKSPGMMYTNVHNWQQGFAYAVIENGQHPHVHTVKISPDYSCYIGRRKLVA